LYFKYYTINYQNPQANVYNYTGLTGSNPSGISLIIAHTSWTSGRPTGLYISNSTSSNSSIIAWNEQNTAYNSSWLTAVCVLTESKQLYVFDRRESLPGGENKFHLLIYSLKYKQV
jgi:hypothetical protein